MSLCADRILKGLIVPLFVVLFSQLCFAADTERPQTQLAPINPAFLEYLKKKDAATASAQSDHSAGLGLIPTHVDLSYLQKLYPEYQAKGLDTYPAAFDLRTQGRVTPVEDQGSCGSCWAFVTLGAIETLYAPTEVWNFSENHLKNTNGYDHMECCSGGNILMSTAYLARWAGPVLETDDPYGPSCTSPAGLQTIKHIQDITFGPDRTGPTDNDQIKNLVQNNGGIYTTIYWTPAAYNPSSASYYYAGDKPANHAVVIVGWDDNYSRYNFTATPPGDGAFIVKNSWGTNFGQNGFMYVSYHDTVVGTGNASFSKASINYSHIYQYDPYGWIWSFGYQGYSHCWAANVFTSDANEDLVAAGIYALAPNTTYDLYVYLDPPAGTPIGSSGYAHHQTGSFATPGFRTIVLSSPVTLSAGQKFSIVVDINTPGMNFPIAVEAPIDYGSGGVYFSGCTAAPGQSFHSINGTTWLDYYYDNNFGNMCLKAYTRPVLTAPTGPGAMGISQSQITWTWQDTTTAETGFKVFSDPGSSPPSTLQTTTPANATSWLQGSLSANTQYSFQVAATDTVSDSPKTENITRCTLAVPPVYASSGPGAIQCDKGAGSPTEQYGVSTVEFTAVNGFGVGSDKAYKYGYLWDTNPGDPASWSSEQFWTSGTLVVVPPATGSYYLHLRSYNASGVANPVALNLGPYNFRINCSTAKTAAIGVPVSLTNKIVSADFTEVSGCIYIMEPDRSSGIRVVTSEHFAVGDRVNVSGTVANYMPDGLNIAERQIANAIVTKVNSGAAPTPVIMNCQTLGGAALAQGPPAVSGGSGVYNIGTLVTLAGKVTDTFAEGFYLTDGSTIPKVDNKTGVVIKTPPTAVPVSANDWVILTGISEGYIPTGQSTVYRSLQLRNWADLTKVSSASPTGVIFGTVRDTFGLGVQGATVSTDTGGYSTTTAAGGAYALTNVGVGTYNVTASKANYGPQTNYGVVSQAGRTTLSDFVLIPSTGTINGYVRDAFNAPISGALVQTDTGGYSQVSQEDGSYEIDAVSPGTYSITASKTGYVSQTLTNKTVTVGEATSANFGLGPASGYPLNPGFENGFNSGLASNWRPFVVSGSPEFQAVSGIVHGGTYAQKWWSNWKTHDAGIMQQVPATIGVDYTFSAWTYRDDYWHNGADNEITWVGIDPYGGLDAQSINVIWSSSNYTVQRWTKQKVTATAQSGTITVFVRGRAKWGGGNMLSQVDDCQLQPVSDATGTLTGYVREPSGAAIGNATVTVNPGSYSVTSNLSGWFEIDVPQGTYTVNAAKSGFKTQYRAGISVPSQNSSRMDFCLVTGGLNFGFEGVYTYGLSSNWSTFIIEGTPEYLDETSTVHGGSHAQRWWTSWATHDAGIFQQVGVTSGTSYTFSAWTWRHDDWNNGTENQTTWVGIDPYGGIDPLSANVVWSSGLYSYETWTKQQVSAVAQSSTITLFVRGKAHWGGSSMRSVVDDAQLTW